VIVIGAGRSGTNLLRDIICSLDGFGTWPCDEINYVWRHGNRSAPSDELQPSDARPDVKRSIHRAFERQARRRGVATLVEKTCANSLRVAFVQEVFPDARFVSIVRDGRDVVSSAMKRWTAPLDIPYVARKARFVPPADLPYYATRYLGARLRRVRSPEGRLGSWGPRFHGMPELLAERPLAEVCARQWLRCVEAAETQQAASVDAERLHRVRYEELVHKPTEEIGRLVAFLGASMPPSGRVPDLKTGSVGVWRSQLSLPDQAVVISVVEGALRSLGYSA
jgi:Sulfotransferase family